jgi:23S rRNA pseudouridine1911/1915/1917 synthase
LNKPASMLTQGPPEVPSLEALVKAYLKETYAKAGNVYLGIPHRLDRPVSGVIVFARTSKAANRLAEQFQHRQVTKVYWGLVEGLIDPAEGTWQDWVLKIRAEARSAKVDEGVVGAQLAELRYRCISPARAGTPTLVEFVPRTGRMHQIRLQASVHGHPILGDRLYGSTLPFGPDAELPRDRIIALHARSLTILHPIRYEPLTFEAPLPEIWRAYMGWGFDAQRANH